jgi:hypothetical protein
MKREVIEKTVKQIYEERDSFSFPDYQREPKLWRIKDKQLLIDSILRDIDIPKLYFYKEKNGKTFDVVDGQQRLWAIWEFIDNEYAYESQGRSKKFSQLDQATRDRILSYKLQITLITDASEDYLRELFLRLQLGLLLNTGEKLHALSGVMRDFVFKILKNHKFIKGINIPNRRFAKETLCAQIGINSFSRATVNEFSRTRYEDLRYFLDQYQSPAGKDLDFCKNQSKTILITLDNLGSYFGENAHKLRNRSLILSIYLFIEEFSRSLDVNSFKKNMPKFVDFVLKFSKRLKEESKAGFNRKNKELYIFETFLSNAPGEKYQIENRHTKLKDFFKYYQENNGKIKGDK